MIILVTGGKGFVASAYIKEMEKEGHECIIYDLPENDICDNVGLRLDIQKVEMVAHFAAVADLNESIAKPDLNFNVNIKATYNIAKICRQYNKDLIFISTCCVYGNTNDLVEKEFYTNPMADEPYATSKIAGEAILRGTPGLNYCILRIGTVYGVNMRDALFTGIVFNKLKKYKPVFIDGDGKQSRQLIYIDDLVLGMKRATLRFKNLHGEIINLCGIEKISALKTLEVAESIYSRRAEIVLHREQRYGQTFEENISIERADLLLGWKPKMKFYEGMKYTFENDKRWKDGSELVRDNTGIIRNATIQDIDRAVENLT